MQHIDNNSAEYLVLKNGEKNFQSMILCKNPKNFPLPNLGVNVETATGHMMRRPGGVV